VSGVVRSDENWKQMKRKKKRKNVEDQQEEG